MNSKWITFKLKSTVEFNNENEKNVDATSKGNEKEGENRSNYSFHSIVVHHYDYYIDSH